MADSRYTWVAFYMELADKLVAFKDNRQELIRDLQALYGDIGIKLPKLDSLETPADIDPYTVFGLFNKGITEANRKKIISGMADKFGVAAAQPRDFTGLPVLNNLNATFYAFSDDERRGERDIDNLWRVFEAELALSAEDDEPNRKAFVDAFDDTVGQFGLGWKLTMGLYWARPHDFINLDSRNRWFMGDEAKAGADIANVVPKEKDAALHDGTRYLSICDAVKAKLGTDECPYESLPELSGAAFAESERVNREKKAAAKAAEQEAEENALGDADVETVHYWLYAPGEGASMWDDFYERGVMGLGWSELGDLESYGSKEEMRLKLQEADGAETSQNNSAHAVWQFAHDIKPGDVVYAKRGRSEIIGRGVVTGGYAYDAAGGRYPSTREVRWTRKGSWRYDGMFAMKTLTDITDYPEVVGKIGALFDDEDEPEAQPAAAEYPAYGREDFLSEVFMDESQYDTLTGVLRAKKNVILQGAPGVGKTFAAKRLAYSMMGAKDADRVQMVQFHQSYSYEDFIEGYRPSADGFELAKGSFYTFCKKAADDADNDYFFIIDEINRGNLSKIFGELFMLIENDKRGPKNKLQLLYSRELFYVPGNVYLVGMMNTADRSLAMLDYALRRRFAFFDLRPGFETDGFKAYREGLGSAKLDALVAAVERLNAAIAEDDTLGEGFCIGHSYFCGLKPGDVTDSKLSAIVEYELVPMLREYWFDDPAKVREWSDALRRAVK
ncbi:MAG: AAA family ATPase [Parafannyhessea umbonata]|uniref:AAA family ATPase n=1 Tax=Parafannyhessea umbonata TaxID=604330 RepID=UPI0026EA8B18|nr:AAA family ATPase [Parafannyhessea umbonata]MCI6680813.1 AAA family ATPase [Parafannyhessea umbonata]